MELSEAERIQGFLDAYEDLPDGAFWAALEEQGIYPEDVDMAQDVLEEAYGA